MNDTLWVPEASRKYIVGTKMTSHTMTLVLSPQCLFAFTKRTFWVPGISLPNFHTQTLWAPGFKAIEEISHTTYTPGLIQFP